MIPLLLSLSVFVAPDASTSGKAIRVFPVVAKGEQLIKDIVATAKDKSNRAHFIGSVV